MNVVKWIWCLHCERCYEVHLHREPCPADEERQEYGEGPFNFVTDLEMQLGTESEGRVFAECPYDDCDGSALDFWWWDTLREKRLGLPEVPQEGQVYPLYP